MKQERNQADINQETLRIIKYTILPKVFGHPSKGDYRVDFDFSGFGAGLLSSSERNP